VGLKWYKRDPTAALEGMAELSLEERGAYNTVLDLIYARGGSVPDDDRFLAGWMRCDVRVWRRIRKRLVNLGKLYVEDGTLHNKRADRELLDAARRIGSAMQAGIASGAKRRFRSQGRDAVQHRGLSPRNAKQTSPNKSPAPDRENKDLARTSVERTLELSTSTKIEGQPRKKPHEESRAEQEARFAAKRNGGT
jgi:uncharacterized protein YdaU (DUF1376 family)